MTPPTPVPKAAALDPRQQEAAALLLSAIDLPAPAYHVVRIWRRAAQVCPGITIDQALLGDRRAQLEKARDLIDQVLSEMEQAA